MVTVREFMGKRVSAEISKQFIDILLVMQIQIGFSFMEKAVVVVKNL